MAKKGIRVQKTRKVMRRSTFEHIQGDTVKAIATKDLPTGCSNLNYQEDGSMPVPCTHTMTHVEFRIEWQWHPEIQEKVPQVKMVGYCKSHRPRRIEGALVTLPHWIVKEVNGRGQKSKIRRLEAALYVKVVPITGSLAHTIKRSDVHLAPGSQKIANVVGLCGRKIRSGYVPKVREQRDYANCSKCESWKLIPDDPQV